MAEVRLEHIYKTYKGGVEAVKDLNLVIQDGEFLALLGPSGCGKTSTLRMIVGLEEITRGDLFIGDRRVNNLEPNLRNVALAFETYALYPPLSVRDNIAFCLRARSVPKDEINQRVNEVAAMLDIADILDRKPAELGGGQKQRVSLARALVREPTAFLMDEPLSHLDAAQRAHMRVELKRLHARTGRTTVLVTHDQLEAVAMAERIAVMNFGELQQVGDFNEVYNNPVNAFVAGFIGEPPMNFLACEPQAKQDDLYLHAVDDSFTLKLPPELRAKVNTVDAERIDLGIRPTDILIGNGQAIDRALELPAAVGTYESLGEEGQLAAKVGANEILVVTPPFLDLTGGDTVSLSMRTERVHLFNAATGMAL